MSIENLNEIKELKNLIMSINLDKCEFVCLDSVNEYFNHPGLCGVVYNGNKYTWCHQDFPEGGDRPNSYYTVRSFDTIDELIAYIKRHIRAELSLRYTTETFCVHHLFHHSRYGYCTVCSELIDETWKAGYYTLEGDSLKRRGDAEKIICPSCKEVFGFDDTNISIN